MTIVLCDKRQRIHHVLCVNSTIFLKQTILTTVENINSISKNWKIILSVSDYYNITIKAALLNVITGLSYHPLNVITFKQIRSKQHFLFVNEKSTIFLSRIDSPNTRRIQFEEFEFDPKKKKISTFFANSDESTSDKKLNWPEFLKLISLLHRVAIWSFLMFARKQWPFYCCKFYDSWPFLPQLEQNFKTFIKFVLFI